MSKLAAFRLAVPAIALVAAATMIEAQSTAQAPNDARRLVAAMLGETPLLDDLADLADRVGGRPTGSEANLRSVEWSLARFQEAGVMARKEAFTMPGLWLERSASAVVRGDGVGFAPRVAAMPFSTGTASGGQTAPLLDAGSGSAADFQRLGGAARGAFALVETPLLTDIEGLFAEYTEAAAIEERAVAAGVAGVVYMGSRPWNTLYRHNASLGFENDRPMLVMERDAAARALRLLRRGLPLSLTVELEIESGPAYESYNVIGEIRGAMKPDEVVIIGAHLDSWDLGTGVLDNGANVVMLIDIARQMKRLGIQPDRTIRFALWNGEEQGLLGSFGYVQSHADELDGHVMAGSVDIGCGRITGFFTGGRGELIPILDRALEPVEGLGPFQHVNVPIVGTDNYDFMLEGVANLVANHAPATYGPNYHARTDVLSECDPQQLRLNAAIVAATVFGFAEDGMALPRQTAADVAELVESTDLGTQMKTFGLYDAWLKGERGRR
jgi:hypothetical protein